MKVSISIHSLNLWKFKFEIIWIKNQNLTKGIRISGFGYAYELTDRVVTNITRKYFIFWVISIILLMMAPFLVVLIDYFTGNYSITSWRPSYTSLFVLFICWIFYEWNVNFIFLFAFKWSVGRFNRTKHHNYYNHSMFCNGNHNWSNFIITISLLFNRSIRLYFNRRHQNDNKKKCDQLQDLKQHIIELVNLHRDTLK